VCIEIDTDGIYVSKHIDEKDLNNYMSERVKQLLGVQENEMQLDFEEYKEGYFIEDQESNKRKGSDDIGDRTGKMKTYILYDMKDNLVIHGGALKGSKQPKCFDIALEKLIRCILKGEGSRKDVINDVLDIAKYDVKDLVFGVKLNQSPDDYDKTSMYAKLIAKARALGMEVKAGSELDYVKTWDGSEFVHTVQSLREIDKRHYEDMISKLIINLGLKEELMSKDTDAVDEWL
jgi:DNA polymerase elongation subunit (family B)